MASLLALSEDVHCLRNKINVLYVVVEVAQVVLLVIVGDANWLIPERTCLQMSGFLFKVPAEKPLVRQAISASWVSGSFSLLLW